VFAGQFVKGLDGRIQQRAREKLKYLDSAADLRDLMVPPSNHLESLKGDREGQFQHPDQQTVARYFGTTAQLWQNLQAQYDLEIASQKIGKKVEHAIKPLARPDLPGSPAQS